MSDAIPPNMSLDTLLKTGVIRDKSGIERAFERLRESGDKAEFHAIEAVKGMRQIGESGVAGAILGALHASGKTGLDIAAPGMAASAQKIPLDGLGMALGFVGGVFLADEPHGAGKTLMNAAAACSAVFMFRQTNDLMTKLSIKKSGITPGGGAALPNASQAAVQPGVISKATFAGEGSATGIRRGYGQGFHASSARGSSVNGEDAIASLARNLP